MKKTLVDCNRRFIGVSRIPMCSYNKLAAAWQAKCMFRLLKLKRFIPGRILNVLFTASFESGVWTQPANIWVQSAQNNSLYGLKFQLMRQLAQYHQSSFYCLNSKTSRFFWFVVKMQFHSFPSANFFLYWIIEKEKNKSMHKVGQDRKKIEGPLSSFVIIWLRSNNQGSYGSWKTWKVLEFY